MQRNNSFSSNEQELSINSVNSLNSMSLSSDRVLFVDQNEYNIVVRENLLLFKKISELQKQVTKLTMENRELLRANHLLDMNSRSYQTLQGQLEHLDKEVKRISSGTTTPVRSNKLRIDVKPGSLTDLRSPDGFRTPKLSEKIGYTDLAKKSKSEHLLI